MNRLKVKYQSVIIFFKFCFLSFYQHLLLYYFDWKITVTYLIKWDSYSVIVFNFSLHIIPTNNNSGKLKIKKITIF